MTATQNITGVADEEISYTQNATTENTTDHVQVSNEGGIGFHDGGAVLLVFLVLLILVSLVENLLVVVAVFTDRRLKEKKSNMFLVSLALADLSIDVVVMPLGLIKDMDLAPTWTVPAAVCKLWLATDITASTASILHLCIISYDRLQQVTDPFKYELWMSNSRMVTFILCLWVISITFSYGPLFLGLELRNRDSVPTDYCLTDLDATYAIASSFVSFYIPAVIMIYFYAKLYYTALRHSTEIRKISTPTSTYNQREVGEASMSCSTKISITMSKISNKYQENKATFTLGIINGVFLASWLPFFIFNVTSPFCSECYPLLAVQIFVWLGAANSGMNSIIYSIFNREFRRAFSKILCPSARLRNWVGLFAGSSGGASTAGNETLTSERRMNYLGVRNRPYGGKDDECDRSSMVRFDESTSSAWYPYDNAPSFMNKDSRGTRLSILKNSNLYKSVERLLPGTAMPDDCVDSSSPVTITVQCDDTEEQAITDWTIDAIPDYIKQEFP
jgi:dopamine receptor D5